MAHWMHLPQYGFQTNDNQQYDQKQDINFIKRWNNFLQKRKSSAATKRDDCKEFVRDKVPRQARAQIWIRTLQIDVAMMDKKDLYQNMLKKALENPDSIDYKTIEKDLHRTFPVSLSWHE
jgi:hypothetical protein